MGYSFDNNTSFEEYEEFVCDFARDDNEKAQPVRVQAFATFVRDKGMKWTDKRAVRAWFDEEKRKHLPGIEKAAGGSSDRFRVYVIG
jgi:hypothetical protein